MAKSVIQEAKEIQLAMTLIKLGARLQFLEAETSLSRDRLIKLYKEIRGMSPPKGLLPFSTDWFMTWQANIHSSMFYNIYRFMVTHGECEKIVAVIKSYRLYLEQAERHGGEAILDFTRAWTLVRFFDSDMLQLTPCTHCDGKFVAHAHDLQVGFACALCRPPSRAGKTRKAATAAAKVKMAAAELNKEKEYSYVSIAEEQELATAQVKKYFLSITAIPTVWL